MEYHEKEGFEPSVPHWSDRACFYNVPALHVRTEAQNWRNEVIHIKNIRTVSHGADVFADMQMSAQDRPEK